MSKEEMRSSLIAKIVVLGICSTPLLAKAYVTKLSLDQFKTLAGQLMGSKVEKAIRVAAGTGPGSGPHYA